MKPVTITIGSALDPIEVTVLDNKTLKSVLTEHNIPISGGVVFMHNVQQLGYERIDSTLAELGVQDGDSICYTQKLSSSYK